MKLTHLTTLCLTLCGCGIAVKLLLLSSVLGPASTVAIVAGGIGAGVSYWYAEKQAPPA